MDFDSLNNGGSNECKTNESGRVYRDNEFFVGGIQPKTQKRAVRDYFSQYGVIKECRLMRDKVTKRFRGFGFISYHSLNDGVDMMSISHEMDGEIIQIKKAYSKEKTLSIQKDEKERKIFVNRLTEEIDEQDLLTSFSKFGEIENTKIIREKGSNVSRGFGFVLFKDPADAAELLSKGDHIEVKGIKIEVHQSINKEDMKDSWTGNNNWNEDGREVEGSQIGSHVSAGIKSDGKEIRNTRQKNTQALSEGNSKCQSFGFQKRDEKSERLPNYGNKKSKNIINGPALDLSSSNYGPSDQSSDSNFAARLKQAQESEDVKKLLSAFKSGEISEENMVLEIVKLQSQLRMPENGQGITSNNHPCLNHQKVDRKDLEPQRMTKGNENKGAKYHDTQQRDHIEPHPGYIGYPNYPGFYPPYYAGAAHTPPIYPNRQYGYDPQGRNYFGPVDEARVYGEYYQDQPRYGNHRGGMQNQNIDHLSGRTPYQYLPPHYSTKQYPQPQTHNQFIYHHPMSVHPHRSEHEVNHPFKHYNLHGNSSKYFEDGDSIFNSSIFDLNKFIDEDNENFDRNDEIPQENEEEAVRDRGLGFQVLENPNEVTSNGFPASFNQRLPESTMLNHDTTLRAHFKSTNNPNCLQESKAAFGKQIDQSLLSGISSIPHEETIKDVGQFDNHSDEEDELGGFKMIPDIKLPNKKISKVSTDTSCIDFFKRKQDDSRPKGGKQLKDKVHGYVEKKVK